MHLQAVGVAAPFLEFGNIAILGRFIIRKAYCTYSLIIRSTSILVASTFLSSESRIRGSSKLRLSGRRISAYVGSLGYISSARLIASTLELQVIKKTREASYTPLFVGGSALSTLELGMSGGVGCLL